MLCRPAVPSEVCRISCHRRCTYCCPTITTWITLFIARFIHLTMQLNYSNFPPNLPTFEPVSTFLGGSQYKVCFTTCLTDKFDLSFQRCAVITCSVHTQSLKIKLHYFPMHFFYKTKSVCSLIICRSQGRTQCFLFDKSCAGRWCWLVRTDGRQHFLTVVRYGSQ